MTQSLEDYLETVYLIVLEKKVARVKDVSERMGVKKPSVINAIRELEHRALVQHEKYGYIELTKEGLKVAEKIYKTHVLLKKFLMEILGVSEAVAEQDACQMEHIMSKESLEGIENFFKNSKRG